MRCPVHLAATNAIGLLIGLIVVPLDAAPRRSAPIPRPRPAILDARSSAPPVSASQNRDQKQAGRTDDAARDDEACLARLRAADVRFDIPIMPVAAKASCAIEAPVRLKSLTTRAPAVTEVHLPEEPIVRQVVKNPTYHYDPRFKFKGVRAHEKLTIAPGPNNPVGLVWIDLTKASYGIHGTPRPEEIGKTQSHGCIRLTNWDALDLAKRVRKRTPVAFLDETHAVSSQ
jgi:L,D-transpeptidase-like protein